MATSGTTYNEREFLFRLQTLIIDGGTDVLRSIFDQKLGPMPLSDFLATEKTRIKRLRAQKTITRAQYELLFPLSGQPPNSVHFPITLLICLLRNLQSLGLNQNYFWNGNPQPTDISVEADMCRLKGFRNEISDMSSTVGLGKATFLSKWTEIEQVLLRLNNAVRNPIPNLHQVFYAYKHDPLDPVAEKRIQKENAHLWKTETEKLKGRVQELEYEVVDVKKYLKNMKFGESLGRRFHVKQEVRSLIKMGKLPDQRLLNELSSECGRKSEKVKHICRKVCEHIKTVHQNILDVWAAYTLNDVNKVIFVVVVNKENVRLEKTINYSFIKRVASQYSQEAEDVLHSKRNFPLDRDEQRKMSTAICNHAMELMKKHKYLSIISESSVRSRNYGMDARNPLELAKEGCIALYVHTKHYIPIDEEPFEMFYDDVPVDVREGTFHLYGLTAKDVHEQIKIGCQIGNAPNDENPQGLAGCLGFFVDHPIYNLCGLTCAHVLLHPWGMKEVKKNGGILNWPDFSPHETVYQPGGAEASHAVGQIVQAIYEEGAAGTKCGIEVALFQIDRRQPISGEFPSLSNGRDAELLFDSGKSCGFSHVDAGSQVMKFGPSTDKTIGELVDQTAMDISVKTTTLHGNYSIKLFHQVHVKGIEQAADGTPLPFSAEGDSGSLVFTKDCNGELLCVGIVEGGTSFGTTVVTPIKPILQKLGVPNI